MASIEAPSPHLLGVTEKTNKNPHKGHLLTGTRNSKSTIEGRR